MNKKEKGLVNSLSLINGGALGIIFLSIQLYFAVQNFSYFSGYTWAFLALGFAVFGGSLIWGFIQAREREVHFKSDVKTKRMIRLELFLNVLGIILIAIGELIVYYYLTPGEHTATSVRPYFLQGIAIFVAGMTILVSTFYLYNRFIPEQVVKEPEMGNSQNASLD